MTLVHYSSCHRLPDCLISFICSLFIFTFQKIEVFLLFSLSPTHFFIIFFKIFAVLDQQCSRNHLNMGKILPGRAEASDC